MSIDKFNPTLWASDILANLHTKLVYASTCNTNYQGTISEYGQVVKIHGIGAITVIDYAKYGDLGDPQVLDDSEVTLTIDQSKAFNFVVDDIDYAQQNPKVMDEATRESAYALAKVCDTFVAGLYPATAAANVLAPSNAPIALSAADAGKAYELLVDLGVTLDEADVPAEDRDVVVPPAFKGLMLKDNRFVMQAADGANFRDNGVVATAAGFNIKISNNVPQSAPGTFVLQASHTSAKTFASQILKTEAYRPQRMFGDALKGLHVYGAKVVRPTCLAVAHVTIGA